MQLGKTEGIITILRGVPHNASRLRKVYLPVSVLTEHQVSSESLIRNTVDQEKMKILVESMAAVADDHLGTIHILRKHIFRLFEPPKRTNRERLFRHVHVLLQRVQLYGEIDIVQFIFT